jgi:hypothetical protein
MRQTRSFFDYIGAAFNARPFGMFVAPNWVGLAAFGALGLADPGFWVLGAGLELGYLVILSTNARFRRLVGAAPESAAGGEWQQKITALLGGLDRAAQTRYDTLSARCRSILDQQSHGGEIPEGLQTQREGLSRLLWMYLRLLVARQNVERLLQEANVSPSLDKRAADLEAQVARAGVSDDLRRSLNSQLEILKQRQHQQGEAHQKLEFLEAELVRIQEQVELIREQAALSTDPELLSQRIDQIAATLGGTAQWIRDEQQLSGAMEDLIAEPPPLLGPARAREHQ